MPFMRPYFYHCALLCSLLVCPALPDPALPPRVLCYSTLSYLCRQDIGCRDSEGSEQRLRGALGRGPLVDPTMTAKLAHLYSLSQV